MTRFVTELGLIVGTNLTVVDDRIRRRLWKLIAKTLSWSKMCIQN